MATTDTSVAGIARWCPAGRLLHQIDADNLAGSEYPTVAQVREVHDGQAPNCCGDRVPTAPTSPFSMQPPGSALLDAAARIGDVSRRFAGVVLGSGDGSFSPAVRSIRATCMSVTVAWGRGSLSRQLEYAASQTLQIFSSTTPRSTAAHRATRTRRSGLRIRRWPDQR